MRLSLILILSLVVACGEKKKTAPLKASSSSSSSLSVSPTGISETQKLFDLYSRNGRLTLAQIRNIGNRMSPLFGAYLNRIQIEETPGALYNAREFFTLLGEFNRVLRWALEHDLSTATGWENVLSQYFGDASPAARAQSMVLINRALAQQDRFLASALKVGDAYNTVESFQLAEGSFGMNLVRYRFLALGENRGTQLSDATVNLLKFNLILDYVLISDDPALTTLVAPQPGPISRWVLDGFKRSMELFFPQLNFAVVDQIYWTAVSETARDLASKTNLRSEHQLVQPNAYSFIGLRPGDSNPETWSALGAFNYAVSTCASFRPNTTTEAWVNFLNQEIGTSGFDLYGADFCTQLSRFTTATDRIESSHVPD